MTDRSGADAATEAETQTGYQVRFDWGTAGAARVSNGADAVVWVDELGTEVAPTAPDVVVGSLAAASEVAAWALERQTALGGRFTIAVVAAGVTRADGSLRFAVEDLLAAGAVIEAIAELGIDHQSPEAAAAASAFHGLRRGTGHLIAASVTAKELRG